MEEKHGGIWISVEEDDSAEIVYEFYDKEKDLIFVVYKRNDGGFTPYFFKKGKDPQWALPIWSQVNEKSIYFSFEDAKTYLERVVNDDI